MLISVVIVRGLLYELRRAGVDPDRALLECGLSADSISDFRAMVPAERVLTVAAQALTLTRDPALALHLGSKAPEEMLQLVGNVLVTCRTAREAFNLFRRYAPLLFEGGRYELTERDSLAYFTFDTDLPLAISRFCAEYALAMVHNVGLHFANRPDGSCVEAWFRHEAPVYAREYGRVFNAPVRFEQQTNTLVFPRELLDAVQLHGDPVMCSLYREGAERLLAERALGTNLADRVRALLSSERELAQIDAQVLARKLAMSPRALRRRLSAEGEPLSVLLDEARCRVACQDLRRPDNCIKQTAELLGFSEPSAFHRAFKRWTGRTPAEYRNQRGWATPALQAS